MGTILASRLLRRAVFAGCLAAAVCAVCGVPEVADAAAPSTLTGEEFLKLGGPTNVVCRTTGPYSYTVSGMATGPYPGTFTETGSGKVVPPAGAGGHMTLSASFTIHSGSVVITGSKSGGDGIGCQSVFGETGGRVFGLSYQATIKTATGTYSDQGSSDASPISTGPSGTTLRETFSSSLSQPLLIPTSKDQCKDHGGWMNYPQFKNEGDCVSFVDTGGKNPPSG